MTRLEAIEQLIPIVRRSMALSRPEVLAACNPMSRRVVAPAYDLLVRYATPILTRIAVEVGAVVAAPMVNPMLHEALEFFDSREALHPAVATALSEPRQHE